MAHSTNLKLASVGSALATRSVFSFGQWEPWGHVAWVRAVSPSQMAPLLWKQTGSVEGKLL